MLATRRTRPPATSDVLPAPRQRLFAQLNVRLEADLDARFKRYCMIAQVKQAQALAEALDLFLKSKDM